MFLSHYIGSSTRIKQSVYNSCFMSCWWNHCNCSVLILYFCYCIVGTDANLKHYSSLSLFMQRYGILLHSSQQSLSGLWKVMGPFFHTHDSVWLGTSSHRRKDFHFHDNRANRLKVFNDMLVLSSGQRSGSKKSASVQYCRRNGAYKSLELWS